MRVIFSHEEVQGLVGGVEGGGGRCSMIHTEKCIWNWDWENLETWMEKIDFLFTVHLYLLFDDKIKNKNSGKDFKFKKIYFGNPHPFNYSTCYLKHILFSTQKCI